MAEKIRVSTQSLKSDAEKMKTELDSLPRLLAQLQAQMVILGQCWEGAGWDATQVKVKQDLDVLSNAMEYYAKIAQGFADSSKTYNDNEQSIYDSI